ncbi:MULTISPECIES: gamma-glutamylcyclotransferase family protein [Microbacterium]|uniref:gamma-glutamylcyclotransferase family protein n=1 Tax=Microbacterium TaxID=33882 RepID=UPI0027D8C875|nr:MULTISPECIES: gamma-glutamylcyclotransferase family protein [Microbacterium]
MSDRPETVERLFTYGSLQASDVQLDTFGRLIAGRDDTLPGFRLDDVDGIDGRSNPSSHTDRHRVLRHTGDAHDRVFGVVLPLSPEELEAADEYLLAGLRRASVTLASGLTAWVYVSA